MDYKCGMCKGWEERIFGHLWLWTIDTIPVLYTRFGGCSGLVHLNFMGVDRLRQPEYFLSNLLCSFLLGQDCKKVAGLCGRLSGGDNSLADSNTADSGG